VLRRDWGCERLANSKKGKKHALRVMEQDNYRYKRDLAALHIYK
jgi:hypothetical protein